MSLENNSEIVFVVKTCKGREHYLEDIKSEIPNVVVSFDNFKDSGLNDKAYQNFTQALLLAGDNPTIQLEDDVDLCDDFINKAKEVISERPNDVIQFFSMRKDDLLIGSRYDAGSKYMMLQCTYFPKGMAKDIYNFSLDFNKDRKEKNSPTDVCVAHYLKKNKLKYWIQIPNLVDHKIGMSSIDSRRSSKRQSLTFNNGKKNL